MISLYKNNFNLQILISYLGIFPFIIILIDIHVFGIFYINLLKDFIFFYTLLIFTFVGAVHWNFVDKPNTYQILFGFCPSLISVFLIVCYLMNSNINFLIFLVLIFLVLQLVGDFIFYKFNGILIGIFFKIRLPLTLLVLINLSYLISV